MQSVAVYCGSNSGAKSEYTDVAKGLGKRIAAEGWTLIYGAGNVGLMGTVADAVLEAGGDVVGVIPELLMEKEVAHLELTEIHTVTTMHERKKMMIDLADGFVALPGGFGTLEELSEVCCWYQLGIHQKPCALLNIEGFYDQLIAFLNTLVDQKFSKPEHIESLLLADNVDDLVGLLKHFEPSYSDKWIDRE